MTTPHLPAITIVLVTWNGQRYIRHCLDAIMRQRFTDYLLLIIDNGSIDETVALIEQQALFFGDKARLVKNKENRGFAAAHNQGILWSDSDYILCLNQDVVLDELFLQESVAFLSSHARAGAINGKLLKMEVVGDEGLTSVKKTDTIDSLGIRMFRSHRAAELGTDEKDSGQYQEAREIFGVTAAAAVFRRAALDDVRYEDEFFDNDFFSYKEDIDLSYRLRWRGWELWYAPRAVAYQIGRAHI